MARMIDTQILIEEIQSSLDIPSHSEHDKGFDDGLNYVLDIIDTYSTLTQPNEWVNVEERLPKINAGYIVCCNDEGCPHGEGIWYQKNVVVYADYYDGSWTWYEGSQEYDLEGIVTHWMPIPAPPDRRPPEGEA